MYFRHIQRLIILLFVGNCLSCKEEAPLPDAFTLLTQAPWRQVSEQERYPTSPQWGSNNWFPQPCEADNLHIFSRNGDYQVDEGPSKCNSNAPQLVFFSQWAFTKPNKEILLNNEPFIIAQIDRTNLILLYYRQLGNRTLELRRDFVR
jgi:hypothetical protein